MATIITVVSGNLNDYGNNGAFETSYTPPSWGAYFGNFPSATITRSSTYAHTGTYSCRIQPTFGNSYTVLKKIAHHTITNYNKYRCRAWIRTPNASKITVFGSLALHAGAATQTIGYANVTQSVYSFTDQWAMLEIRYQGKASGSFDCFVDLVCSSGSVSSGGEVFIDDVEIVQIIETDGFYEIIESTTPASGPLTSDGTITLSGSPVGLATFEYSIQGGASGTYQSSGSFTGLASGVYSCAMIDSSIGSTIIAQKLVVLGVVGALFDFSVAFTNETSPSASDGTVTVTITNSTGSPFTYRLRGPGLSGALYADTGYVGSGSFTSLNRGFYIVTVKDTHGNEKSKNINISSDPICAISFDQSALEITDASDEGVADGIIQVNAFDNVFGGTTWYKLGSDFIYPAGDNTTGLFDGLVPGEYTIYARTSTKCVTFGTFEVKNASTFGVRYRLEFNGIDKSEFIDFNGQTVDFDGNNQFRLDIEEKSFSGSITEIEGAARPVVHSWRGESEENPFALTVVSSELQCNLISRTNLYFSDLYTSEERKYRYKFYLYDQWSDDYLLLFQGYGIPMEYSEVYQDSTNYEVSFTATDQLRDLDYKEFTDDGGNYFTERISVLQAVATCLKKTGIRIDIYDKVNLYCDGMDSSESSGSLIQRYFDPTAYRKDDGSFESCLYVLQNILKGCHLYQSGGAWHIELVSEKCNSNVNVQVYNYNGVYQRNFIQSNRILWRTKTAAAPRVATEGAASLSIAQTYGSVKVNYNLNIEDENNLLVNSEFEGVDLENGQLNGWTIEGIVFPLEARLVNSPGRNGQSLAIKFNPGISSDPVTLVSKPVDMVLPDYDYRLKVSFDIYTIPIQTNTYIYFEYRMYMDTSLGRYYLQHVVDFDTGVRAWQTGTTSLLTDGWIVAYVDEHTTWKTFNIETVVEAGGFAINGPLKIEIRFSQNTLYDVGTQTELKAVTTSNYARKNFDNRRRLAGTGPDFVYFYELQQSSESELFPQVVEPDDYGSHKWILQKTVSVDTDYESWSQAILVDNVKIEYYPNDDPPKEEIIQEEIINVNGGPGIEETLLHGDIFYSEDVDLGDYEIDPNYEYLSNSFWSLQDGTKTTGGWYRRGVNENMYFHKLIAKMIRGQFSVPRWKISGVFNTRQKLINFTNTIHEVRTGRVYIPLSLTVDYKKEQTQFEIRESVKAEGVTDDGTVDIGDIPTPEPSDDQQGSGGTLGQHSLEHSEEHD